jgi:protoporphyrinogen oxidase
MRDIAHRIKNIEQSMCVNRTAAILGAGMTGLAAGFVSGLPMYESGEGPGGLAGSYYIRPGETTRLYSPPRDGEVYRFEPGGGHWIWGGDPLVLRRIQALTPFKSYRRKASIYLADRELFVPYPIQYHLSYFGTELALTILQEIVQGNSSRGKVVTMANWLETYFGATLSAIFFGPFHERYTAGLWKIISSPDPSKSPLNVKQVLRGALGLSSTSIGYNTEFLYPVEGLDSLARCMGQHSLIHFRKRAVRIDGREKTMIFSDGSVVPYETLICTLPLDHALQLTGITLEEEADPFTSVLVINVGAKKGNRCPREHWIYIPVSSSGFHRIGFYSNVDDSFLPFSTRKRGDRVSLYVETAYVGGYQPTAMEIEKVSHSVISELQSWGWIEGTEVVDPTWVETAYTWTRPGSEWAKKALRMLQSYDIYQVGRYACWSSAANNMGIADSIRDGLLAGASLR